MISDVVLERRIIFVLYLHTDENYISLLPTPFAVSFYSSLHCTRTIVFPLPPMHVFLEYGGEEYLLLFFSKIDSLCHSDHLLLYLLSLRIFVHSHVYSSVGKSLQERLVSDMRPLSSYPTVDLPVCLIVRKVISFHCRAEPVICSAFLTA